MPEALQDPAREEAALGELRSALGELAATGLDGLGPADDATLLRFLRARKGDVPKAQAQYAATKAWRAENDIARFTRGFEGSASAALAAASHPILGCGGVEIHPSLRLGIPIQDEGAWLFWGQTLSFGQDKRGRPVHIQHVGRASQRFAEAFAHVEASSDAAEAAKAFINGYVHLQEVQQVRMRELAEQRGEPVTQQVVIMDLEGLSMWPDSRAMSVFKEFLQISSSHYPETLALHFFVNAPHVFTAIWRVIRNWLDPVTVGRLHVLGRGFQDVLLEYIDKDQLPTALGGTNPFDLFDRASSRVAAEAAVAELREVVDGLSDASVRCGGG